MVDWTKPIQTVGGRPARVLATDVVGAISHDVVLLVTVNHEEIIKRCRLDGTTVNGDYIINVPEKRVIFVNMYPGSCAISHACHPSRGRAEESATENCIARVRVEYEEGQFD
jgi:hypothetical protein